MGISILRRCQLVRTANVSTNRAIAQRGTLRVEVQAYLTRRIRQPIRAALISGMTATAGSAAMLVAFVSPARRAPTISANAQRRAARRSRFAIASVGRRAPATAPQTPHRPARTRARGREGGVSSLGLGEGVGRLFFSTSAQCELPLAATFSRQRRHVLSVACSRPPGSATLRDRGRKARQGGRSFSGSLGVLLYILRPDLGMAGQQPQRCGGCIIFLSGGSRSVLCYADMHRSRIAAW